MNPIEKIRHFFHSQRHRAVALAVIVLAILAVTQVNHLHPPAQTCELFSRPLKSGELQRIELALGSAGINDFEIVNRKVIVSRSQRSAALKAITDSGAIPASIREQPEAESSQFSMLMTRSQQQAMAREDKKKQIQKMVMRLPFVEQAWFDMDVAAAGSAFQRSHRSAVLSIEPAPGVMLDAAQIDTVTRMIQGAIAGISSSEIQIVDVASGYAYHGDQTFDRNGAVSAGVKGLPALEQQNYFENRIRRSLKGLDGLDVNVRVDVTKNRPKVSAQTASLSPAETAARKHVPMPVTNGSASIYDDVPNEPKVVQVDHQAAAPTYSTFVAVDVAVPQQLVEREAKTSFPDAESSRSGLQAAYEKVRSEIIARVHPLLPVNTLIRKGESPINVRLIRSPTPVVVRWQDRVRSLLERYWPSLAVLLGGVVLIASMTRSDRKRKQIVAETEANSADILSINSMLESRYDEQPVDVEPGDAEVKARREAEQKLSQLIDSDPANAKKVIDDWIRDAA